MCMQHVYNSTHVESKDNLQESLHSCCVVPSVYTYWTTLLVPEMCLYLINLRQRANRFKFTTHKNKLYVDYLSNSVFTWLINGLQFTKIE